MQRWDISDWISNKYIIIYLQRGKINQGLQLGDIQSVDIKESLAFESDEKTGHSLRNTRWKFELLGTSKQWLFFILTSILLFWNYLGDLGIIIYVYHIYIYTCIFTYIYRDTHVYIYIYVYTYVYMYVYIYMYTYVYIRTYVCVYIYIYMYIYR